MANQFQRNPNKEYTPISSDFYSEIESAAMRNENCEIVYLDAAGNRAHLISPIRDLYTENGMEYARMADDLIIRLDQIISVNGKTAANAGTSGVDTDILNEDRQAVNPTPGNRARIVPVDPVTPKADPTPPGIPPTEDQIERLESNEGVIREGDTYQNEHSGLQMPREQFEAYESDIERIEAARDGDSVTEQERQDKDLQDRIRPSAHTADEEPVINQAAKSVEQHYTDLGQKFALSNEAFVVAENDYYQLTVDRLRNRLYLTARKRWANLDSVAELGDHMANIARLMLPPFTLLNDLTMLRPDDTGTLIAPDVPGKDALLNAGLIQVADLVPLDCDTLVHGIHSFSVNSLRMRYFKDRILAENWLTGDDQLSTAMRTDRG